MLAEYSGVPHVTNQKQLIFPNQPFHDDFLIVMRKVFFAARFFGVAGPKKNLWRLWGVLMFLLIIAIEFGAIYKLVKLLMGLTVYSVGNRSITARLAGTMFYTACFFSLVLSWRLSSSWAKIASEWVAVEKKLLLTVPADDTLKRKMIIVSTFMAVGAFLEHLLSILSNLDKFDTSPAVLLQQYVLNSHGFILVPTDYTVWVAAPLFFISNIATVLWGFQDLLIVLISMGLTSRYRRLNQCVAKIASYDKNETKWCKPAAGCNILTIVQASNAGALAGSSNQFDVRDACTMVSMLHPAAGCTAGWMYTETLKIYTWRKIREAYVKQALLVRKVDDSIGGLILLSSSGNFYFICLQLFLGITQGISGNFLKRLYFMVSLVWLILRFSFVVLAAADVNVYSKKALRHLHDCNDQCYNTEIERLIKQLTKDFVALSGVGFFYLDRSMLLQMAASIVTYELVLIQFDGKAGSQHETLKLPDNST